MPTRTWQWPASKNRVTHGTHSRLVQRPGSTRQAGVRVDASPTAPPAPCRVSGDPATVRPVTSTGAGPAARPRGAAARAGRAGLLRQHAVEVGGQRRGRLLVVAEHQRPQPLAERRGAPACDDLGQRRGLGLAAGQHPVDRAATAADPAPGELVADRRQRRADPPPGRLVLGRPVLRRRRPVVEQQHPVVGGRRRAGAPRCIRAPAGSADQPRRAAIRSAAASGRVVHAPAGHERASSHGEERRRAERRVGELPWSARRTARPPPPASRPRSGSGWSARPARRTVRGRPRGPPPGCDAR